jgi:two-component system chemotaxis response regulator CheY
MQIAAPCILTVDDSAAVRLMLKVSLVAVGFVVLQAEDGAQALETLRVVSPNLIITDVNMPRLDGFSLIEQVRRQAHFAHLPIVVLSTEGCSKKRQRATALGATDWLMKPATPAQLLLAVADSLQAG